MAIINPEFVLVDRAQSCTVTVTLTSSVDISAWLVSAVLRAYRGGPAIATKTVGSGITSSYSSGAQVQTWIIAFTTTDTNQTAGGYVWDFRRTDSGSEYEIVEPSVFRIREDAVTGGPTITNLSEYVAHSLNSITLPEPMAKQLVQLLSAAEDYIKRICNRDFVYRSTQTEYYDGNGTSDLYLRRTPVPYSTGIASVYLDYNGQYGSVTGSFSSNSLLVYGTDYSIKPDGPYGDGLCNGVIQRIDAVWPLREHRKVNRLAAGLEPLPGCIQVTYSGGFQLMPDSLKMAVWDLTTLMAQRSVFGRTPMSEAGEGYSYAFGPWDGDMRAIGSVQQVVNTFQRLYPG